MSLARHFDLAVDPFADNASRPYEGPTHLGARQAVVDAVLAGERRIAIVAEPGAGATTLLRAVERALLGERTTAWANSPDLIERGLESSADVLLIDLPSAPFQAKFEGPAVVAVVDPAQAAALPVLVVKVPLPLLSAAEARAFLDSRLREADRPNLITDRALALMAEAGGGSPATLMALARSGLFAAARRSASMIDVADVKRAATDLGRDVPKSGPVAQATPVAALPKPRRPMSTPLARVAATFVFLALSLPVLAYMLGSFDSVPAERTEAAQQVTPATPASTVRAPATLPVATAQPDFPEMAAPGPEPLPEPKLVELAVAPLAAPAIVIDKTEAPAASAKSIVSKSREVQLAKSAIATTQLNRRELARTTAGPRVFVHYTDGAVYAREAAQAVAASLRSSGYTVADVRGVDKRIRRPSIRTYYPADRQTGKALDAAVKSELQRQGWRGRSEVKEIEGYKPAPRPGTLEVWLPTPPR